LPDVPGVTDAARARRIGVLAGPDLDKLAESLSDEVVAVFPLMAETMLQGATSARPIGT
jgi:hypothetical protein